MSDEERTEILKAERERVSEIRGMCRHFDIEQGTVDQWVSNGTAIEDVRAAVQRHLAAQPQIVVPRARAYGYGQDASDKRNAAIVDGLTMRAGVHLANPAPGANEYRGAVLADLARECLLGSGVRVSGMSRAAVIKMALEQRAMGTWSFPELLANTAGKVLRESYLQAPSTFEVWSKKGSASDFKEMSRPILSAADGLDEIPELVPYKYGDFGESAEKFQIATYGKLWAVSRQALINDDLGALTNIPRASAAAAKRMINQLAYAVLTGNANMADGNALFSTEHSNFVAHGSGAVPSVDTLTAARLAMRTQTGIKSETLNIRPAVLIVPAALETASDVLLNSMGMDDENPAVKNPFYKKMILVVEPLLDADDAAAWYLSANPLEFDTIELAYLDGRTEPYLETRDGWTVDGVEYKVRIDAGAKALDWRGLYFNDGN